VIKGPAAFKGLRSGPRIVYSTAALTDSHKVLSGQTNISSSSDSTSAQEDVHLTCIVDRNREKYTGLQVRTTLDLLGSLEPLHKVISNRLLGCLIVHLACPYLHDFGRECWGDSKRHPQNEHRAQRFLLHDVLPPFKI
jgi:hypothetical protein